ncbi:MAG: hypothetical protein AB7G11_16830 [Phycisphaerales bacterium]
MPCLLAVLAFFFPRVVLILLAIFTNYLSTAYQTVLWPVLGFFFLPYTTLGYAFAWHQSGGTVSGGYLVLVIVCVLIDLGVLGGGEGARRGRGTRN